MTIEYTLSIIKPDAVAKALSGQILARFEAAGLSIIGIRMLHLTQREAEQFYRVHKNRPFFNDLVKFMTSGPIVAVALKGEDAVNRYRTLIGETDPTLAKKGTIRHEFGETTRYNAVHGSDSLKTAATEIDFFFPNSKGIYDR